MTILCIAAAAIIALIAIGAWAVWTAQITDKHQRDGQECRDEEGEE